MNQLEKVWSQIDLMDTIWYYYLITLGPAEILNAQSMVKALPTVGPYSKRQASTAMSWEFSFGRDVSHHILVHPMYCQCIDCTAAVFEVRSTIFILSSSLSISWSLRPWIHSKVLRYLRYLRYIRYIRYLRFLDKKLQKSQTWSISTYQINLRLLLNTEVHHGASVMQMWSNVCLHEIYIVLVLSASDGIPDSHRAFWREKHGETLWKLNSGGQVRLALGQAVPMFGEHQIS